MVCLFNVLSVSLGYIFVTLGCCVDAPIFLSEVFLVFMGYIFVTLREMWCLSLYSYRLTQCLLVTIAKAVDFRWLLRLSAYNRE